MGGTAQCLPGAVNANLDYSLKKALKPLIHLKKVTDLPVANPLNFRGALMMYGNFWIRQVGLMWVWGWWNPSLKKMLSYCSGRVPIPVHPSIYWSLKLKFPMDVGSLSRDGRVTTELGIGSLRHAVGIITPRISGRSQHCKVKGLDVSKPCHFECEKTEGSK